MKFIMRVILDLNVHQNYIVISVINRLSIFVSNYYYIESTMDISQLNYSQATPEDICGLIDNTLSGDNQKITYATKVLKAYTKHKLSIKVLSFILMNSENPSHRQMSTILLKRNIVNLYCALDANEQVEFRALLLNQYIKETQLSIQRGIAIIIGMLLPVIELTKWVELQNLLDEAIKSAPHSVATFVLLNCLLYHFKPPKQLYTYLFNALKVPNLADQAMKCIVAVAQTQDVDQKLAIELIQLWEQTNWPEQISLTCLQVFTTLAERRVKLNEQIITWICTHIIINKKLSSKFRISGLDFLSAYAQFHSKSLSSKQSLLRKVIQAICLVCSEPFSQEHQQEEDGEPVQQIALWLIETLAVNLKSKKIYPILLEASTSLINSNDVNQNNTGFLLLGGMAEGCSQKLRKNLENPVMNVLIPKGLNHQSPEVRGAAINALSYFSEYLIPDIVNFHATIIPSMIKSFDDLSPKVAEKAIIAVDVFFDNMEEEDIKQYLGIVIPKFAEVLMRENSTHIMRNVAMSGIGSAIEAAKVSFEPFVQNVYQMNIEFLKIHSSPQLNSVRAQNVSVLGKLSNVFCGKDYPNRVNFYRNYIVPVIEKIYEMLVTDNDPQVRQACFSFFYLLANAIESEFEGIFDKIIPEVFKGAQLREPLKDEKKNQFSLDSDSEDDNFLTSTKASEYDEKSAAIRAIGELANACPLKFSSYFDQSYQILDDHYQFFYESVRVEVSTCYSNLLKAYVKSQNNGVLPTYQCGLPCVQRYPDNIEKYFRTTLVPRMIFMMTQDESSRASSGAIQSFSEMIKSIGPIFIDQSVDKITQAIIQLFESQIAEEDEDQEEQQEDEDTDAYIFQPLCSDLIPTLCQVLQVGFLPSMNEIQPYMSKFLTEREDINDNVQMVGCLSQCFKFLPAFFSAHSQDLFEGLASLVDLNDADLNRNVAYCFAEAIERCPQDMQKHMNHCLLILKNIYENKTSHQACKDNALAAICRAIIVFNPPMPYEMLVGNLISSMPFKGDEQEQSAALRCIMYLYQNNQALIQPYRNNLLNILQNDLSSPKKYKLQGTLLETVTNFYNALQ